MFATNGGLHSNPINLSKRFLILPLPESIPMLIAKAVKVMISFGYPAISSWILVGLKAYFLSQDKGFDCVEQYKSQSIRLFLSWFSEFQFPQGNAKRSR